MFFHEEKSEQSRLSGNWQESMIHVERLIISGDNRDCWAKSLVTGICLIQAVRFM